MPVLNHNKDASEWETLNSDVSDTSVLLIFGDTACANGRRASLAAISESNVAFDSRLSVDGLGEDESQTTLMSCGGDYCIRNDLVATTNLAELCTPARYARRCRRSAVRPRQSLSDPVHRPALCGEMRLCHKQGRFSACVKPHGFLEQTCFERAPGLRD
jgi:hypothetical protein